MLSEEASEIPSWTTMAGKQAHKSSPITAYSSEFLLSAALISPEPSTAATTCPWEDLTRSRGRFPPYTHQRKGWQGGILSVSLAHLVPTWWPAAAGGCFVTATGRNYSPSCFPPPCLAQRKRGHGVTTDEQDLFLPGRKGASN